MWYNRPSFFSCRDPLLNNDYFAENGLLAKAIPGFAPRQAQVHMAEAVSKAIETAGRLLVEAGTGTGKTLPIWFRHWIAASG